MYEISIYFTHCGCDTLVELLPDEHCNERCKVIKLTVIHNGSFSVYQDSNATSNVEVFSHSSSDVDDSHATVSVSIFITANCPTLSCVDVVVAVIIATADVLIALGL